MTACLLRTLGYKLRFFLLIRIQQGQLSRAKMRETDERSTKDRSKPNWTPEYHWALGGKECWPVRMDALNGAV